MCSLHFSYEREREKDLLKNTYNCNKLDDDKVLQGKMKHEVLRQSMKMCVCVYVVCVRAWNKYARFSEDFKGRNSMCEEVKKAGESHWFPEGKK